MKSILKEGCSIKPDKFKNDSTMTMVLPPELKKTIMTYLNAPEPGMLGDMPMIDPVTKECYSRTNVIREADGFGWSSGAIYCFEKYNIMLSDDFVNFIEHQMS